LKALIFLSIKKRFWEKQSGAILQGCSVYLSYCRLRGLLMKRLIIGLLFLVLFANFVFAEDYVVGEPPNPNDPKVLTTSNELAFVRSDIASLSNKISQLEKANADLISKTDVDEMQVRFFDEAKAEMRSFSANLLVFSGVFYVFVLASLFLMKAKKWF